LTQIYAPTWGSYFVPVPKQPGLSLFRVRCNHQQADAILQHRDVRTVDLPPKYGLDLSLLRSDIKDFLEIQKAFDEKL